MLQGEKGSVEDLVEFHGKPVAIGVNRWYE
jgi:hypothetical protein